MEEKLQTKKTFGLSRNFIKGLAIAAMLLNHIANALLTPQSPWYELFLDIGYFTAVTMCYFLVEGYYYTHDRKKYAQRLLLFGLVSQIPYCMALGVVQLNMMFTLLVCFGIVWVIDREPSGGKKAVLLTLLVMASTFMDWALLAPLFTILFALNRGDRRGQAQSFGAAALLFFGFNLMSGQGIVGAVCASLGIIVSGYVILLFYNGQKGKHSNAFSKWFFYLFYPVHLLILGLLRMMLF